MYEYITCIYVYIYIYIYIYIYMYLSLSLYIYIYIYIYIHFARQSSGDMAWKIRTFVYFSALVGCVYTHRSVYNMYMYVYIYICI